MVERCEYLPKDFMTKWSSQFVNATHILSYLQFCPDHLEAMRIKKLHTIDTIGAAQQEWIRFVSNLKDPIDTKFFKTYWLPLDQEDYEYFIDLSTPNYTIFNITYFFIEPFCWFKIVLSEKIEDFLLIETKEEMDALMFEKERQFEKLFAFNDHPE
jgi:hypothetical protein